MTLSRSALHRAGSLPCLLAAASNQPRGHGWGAVPTLACSYENCAVSFSLCQVGNAYTAKNKEKHEAKLATGWTPPDKIGASWLLL